MSNDKNSENGSENSGEKLGHFIDRVVARTGSSPLTMRLVDVADGVADVGDVEVIARSPHGVVVRLADVQVASQYEVIWRREFGLVAPQGDLAVARATAPAPGKWELVRVTDLWDETVEWDLDDPPSFDSARSLMAWVVGLLEAEGVPDYHYVVVYTQRLREPLIVSLEGHPRGAWWDELDWDLRAVHAKAAGS